jgi:SanA protein
MALFQFCRKHCWKLVTLVVLMAAAIFFINFAMVRSAGNLLYKDSSTVPDNDVGLVLGTGPILGNGEPNWHFKVRIDAAAKLYYDGKVKHLLLSGDNHTQGYDEPTEMKMALVKKGVPESAMTLDYAGFRTLDSVVRAKKIFGQQRVTIVTEEFHAARAIFLARHSGLDSVVFCADSLPMKWAVRVELREIGARIKAVLDVYVFHRGPRFLGEKAPINLAAKVD